MRNTNPQGEPIMTIRPSRFACASALAAAFSMAATPAAALDMPVSTAPASTAARAEVLPVNAGEANQWRRYRPYRHRHRGPDAGDVIAGVLVVGALAAILSSSRNRDRERYEDRRENGRYDDRRARGSDSRGIEGAVDMCVDQVEYRDNRVENVDRADRNAGGWNVSGTLSDGQRWTCFIDNSGEVRSIDYGSSAFSSAAPLTPAPASGQMSDAAYSRARATTRTPVDEAYSYDEAAIVQGTGADDSRPAYPGGPLPGEDGYDEDWQVDGDIDESQWEGDGRYTTAQAPDFAQPAR